MEHSALMGLLYDLPTVAAYKVKLIFHVTGNTFKLFE